MLQLLRALNLVELPLDIPFVLHFKLDSIRNLRIIDISASEYKDNFLIGEVLTSQNLGESLRGSHCSYLLVLDQSHYFWCNLRPCVFKSLDLTINGSTLCRELAVYFIRHQTNLMPDIG